MSLRLTWWTKRLTTARCPRSTRRLPIVPRHALPCLELLEDRRLLSAGAIDLTFGNNGVTAGDLNATARAIVVEGDEKIVVLDQTQGGYDVLRYNPDGSLDSTFGDDGKIAATFGAGTSVVDLAILPDGRIVVGGEHLVNQEPVLDVARYNSDGTADSTFGNGGLAEIASDDITAGDMAVSSDGTVVMAGTSGNSIAVVRLDADGTLDPSFGGDGIVTLALGDNAQATGVALQPDGKIVMSGFGNGDLTLARFNTDGSVDATFGAGGIVTAALQGTTFWGSRVAVDGLSGQLIVTAESFTSTESSTDGWSYGQESLTLFRFNPDGSPDPGFGQAGQVSQSIGTGYLAGNTPLNPNVALQDDGKILVAANLGGSTQVLRYDADGSLDLTYGNGGSVFVSSDWNDTAGSSPALALQGDGQLVVLSDSSTWNGNVLQTSAVVTRFQGDSDIRPTPFGSDDAFLQYLIDQAVQQYSDLFGQQYTYEAYPPIVGPIFPLGPALTASASSPAGSPSFSQTNTQVAGVDEGDTVKTDGQYLYLLSNGNLVILNAWPAEDLQTLSVTPLQGTPLVEYLDGDRLTVISQDYQPNGFPIESPFLAGPVFWRYWSQPVVDVTVYDVSDPAAPTVVQETTLDGTYNNSRAIGSTVYVALNATLSSLPPPEYTVTGNTLVYETEAEYEARMETLPLDGLLPHYTTQSTNADGTQESTGLLAVPADIYQPAVPGDNNLLTVVSFDVTGNSGPTNSVSFLTSYDAILYAATDNFYLITNRWSYVNNWTFIDQLNLDDGDMTLTATAQVPGTILNQFSVAENGPYLDIATTSGWWQTSSNNVFVLTQNNDSLDVVGQLEGLAPGETITSVTFLGDRAFVSTADQVNPLFALYLSDPTNPVVAGSLEVPGYTGYLQAIDATHLIGIGEDNGTQGTNLVISLFDVTDLSNPILVSSYTVAPDGWSWSPAEYDYHAITWYPEYQTLAFPVTSEGVVSDPDEPGVQSYFYQTDLLVFNVDTANGVLNLQGEVSDTSAIQRGVFIGNVLYAISDTSVQAYSLDDLTTLVAQAQLPPPTSIWWWPILIAEPLPVTVIPANFDVTVSSGNVPSDASTPATSASGSLPVQPPPSLPGDAGAGIPATGTGPAGVFSGSQATVTPSGDVTRSLVLLLFFSQSTAVTDPRTAHATPQGQFQTAPQIGANGASLPAATTASIGPQTTNIFSTSRTGGADDLIAMPLDSNPVPQQQEENPEELFDGMEASPEEPPLDTSQDAVQVAVWASFGRQELLATWEEEEDQGHPRLGEGIDRWTEKEFRILGALAIAALTPLQDSCETLRRSKNLIPPAGRERDPR